MQPIVRTSPSRSRQQTSRNPTSFNRATTVGIERMNELRIEPCTEKTTRYISTKRHIMFHSNAFVDQRFAPLARPKLARRESSAVFSGRRVLQASEEPHIPVRSDTFSIMWRSWCSEHIIIGRLYGTRCLFCIGLLGVECYSECTAVPCPRRVSEVVHP